MVKLLIDNSYSIVFHRSFKKQYKKFLSKQRVQFGVRLDLLITSPDHAILNIHVLKGEDFPMISMNVSGDIKALFLVDDKKKQITFYKIGTHSELYR